MGKITAAATTGPARHPRPASSQPASILSSVNDDDNTSQIYFFKWQINYLIAKLKNHSFEAMEEIKNPWKTLSGKAQYDNPWINVTEYQIVNPGGGEGIYGKVHFKNKAIGIVALDNDNNIWLVGQYRYTLNEYSWEIPEGGGPLKEDVLEAAKRELREETGVSANSWKMIQRFHTSNSVTDEEGFIFLATDLTQGLQELEESESDLKIKKVHLKEALQMVLDQKITDSMSVTGILLVSRMQGY